MKSTAGRFSSDDLTVASELVEAMLVTPGAWCNFQFEPLDDEEDPLESALFGFLAARGPANPLATIMAPTSGRRPQPTQLGIQHRAGVKAASQLRDEKIVIPEGAFVSQDHPRRGLVVRWPDTSDTAAMISWLYAAMRALSRARTTNDVLWEMSAP